MESFYFVGWGVSMRHLSDVYLDTGMRRFLINTAKREFWRVASSYDIDDLIQDGYVCYYKCVKAYPALIVTEPTKDQRRNFMALVRTAFGNHIINLANKRTKSPSIVQSVDSLVEGEELVSSSQMVSFSEGSFSVLVASAPAEIQALVRLLVSDTESAVEYLKIKKGRRWFRETTNEYYCRILGLDPKKEDVVSRVRAYFAS